MVFGLCAHSQLITIVGSLLLAEDPHLILQAALPTSSVLLATAVHFVGPIHLASLQVC